MPALMLAKLHDDFFVIPLVYMFLSVLVQGPLHLIALVIFVVIRPVAGHQTEGLAVAQVDLDVALVLGKAAGA